MKYFVIVLLYLVILILFFIFWRTAFSPNKKFNTKISKDALKQNLRIQKRQKNMHQYEILSAKLNTLPILRLTKEKKELYETHIAAQCNAYSLAKPTPEELHCKQWLAVLLTFLVGTFSLFVFTNAFGSKGLFVLVIYALIPVAAKLPIEPYRVKENKGQTKKVEEHFLDFFKTYYVSYKATAPTLDLRGTITAYAGTCHHEMSLFCMLFENDIKSVGSQQALKLLQARYPNSSLITRFCALALSVDREDIGASAEVEGFLELLMQEDYDKKESTLERNFQKLGTEINAILMVLLIALVIAQSLSMFTTLK